MAVHSIEAEIVLVPPGHDVVSFQTIGRVTRIALCVGGQRLESIIEFETDGLARMGRSYCARVEFLEPDVARESVADGACFELVQGRRVIGSGVFIGRYGARRPGPPFPEVHAE